VVGLDLICLLLRVYKIARDRSALELMVTALWCKARFRAWVRVGLGLG